MLTSTLSRTADPNDNFSERTRRRGEDNVQWINRLLREYTPDGVVLLLVGGTDALSLRLRFAQAHLRHDMTPSHWSHIALVVDPRVKNVAGSRLVEISLEPAQPFGWAPERNGVQEQVALARYRDADAYPNIAVVDMPPEVLPAAGAAPDATPTAAQRTTARNKQRDVVDNALQRFKKARGTLDCCELIVQWLAFAWGAGQVPNPLVSGRGIPSAVLVETLAAATGFELTPGIDSRASCPEAVWQAARWWYGLHEEVSTRRLTGAYCLGHKLVP